MTGGQSVWLRPRYQNCTALDRVDCKGFRFDQFTGNEMNEGGTQAGNDILARKAARGGFLCDEPGLGKTITILSLILQTMGLSTESKESDETSVTAVDCHQKQSKCAPQPSDDDIFRAYWKELVPLEFRRTELSRLMNRLKKLDLSSCYFLRPIDPERDGCDDYFDVIQHPICINDISRKISYGLYGTDNSNFDLFVADVELCFR